MTTAVSKKPGKGASDGVISELATFFDVRPGHEEELRAAAQRFTEAVRDLDVKDGIRTGLRDTRHVISTMGCGSCGVRPSRAPGTRVMVA